MTRVIAVTDFPADDRAKLETSVRRALKDPSQRVKWAALERIRDDKLRNLEPEVLAFLSHKASYLRGCAAECLGNLHEGERIRAEFLYPLLNDPDWLVRVETLESLVQIVDKSALPLALERLSDAYPVVRSYAADCVATLGGRRTRRRLRFASQTETEDHPKAALAAALFSMGDLEQFPILLGVLGSPVYQARCFAANLVADLDLSSSQLRSAVEAVSYAKEQFLFRADQSTMERVEAALREAQPPSRP